MVQCSLFLIVSSLVKVFFTGVVDTSSAERMNAEKFKNVCVEF